MATINAIVGDATANGYNSNVSFTVQAVDVALTLLQFQVESAIDQGLFLPKFAVDGELLTGEITNDFQESIGLPQLSVTGTIQPGTVLGVAEELPQFVVVSNNGDTFQAGLPQLSVVASLLTGRAVIAKATLPQLSVSVTAFASADGSGVITTTLPQFKVTTSLVTGNTESSVVSLPQFAVVSRVIAGTIIVSSLSLPEISVTAVTHDEYIVTTDLALPLFVLAAEGYSLFAETYAAWAMNTHNNAVTQYASFGFNSFAKIGNRYFAASPTGIYELTGDDDDGTQIDANVVFKKDNFGDTRMSRVVAAYVSADASDDLRLGLNASGNDYVYEMGVDAGGDVVSRRIDTVKGEKAVYWQASVSNVSGADFRINAVELLAKKLGRRV